MTFYSSIALGFITGVMALFGIYLPESEVKASEVKEVKQEVSVVHLGYPEDSVVQEYVQYAYKISGGDIDFLATLDAENGKRDYKRQSQVPDNKKGMSKNGKEDSRGFCQLHRRRHKNIVDNPLFWSDWKRQMEQCYAKYKGGTKFYGYNVRHESKSRFTVTTKNHGSVNLNVTLNLYEKARQASIKRQNVEKALSTTIIEEHTARGECISSKQCK